jgi:hypothetical protein
MIVSRFASWFAALVCLSGCELAAGIEDLRLTGEAETGIVSASGDAAADIGSHEGSSGAVSTPEAASSDDSAADESAPEASAPGDATADDDSAALAPFPVEPTYSPNGYFAKDTGDVSVSFPCADEPPVVLSTPCRTWTYAPNPATDTMNGQFYAGVFWLTNNQDWGTSPGAAIPPGYRAVTFWARGAQGGESVAFWVGGVKGTVYADAFQAPAAGGNGAVPATTLTNQWAKYTISLAGVDYAGGVLGGFGWSASYDPAFGAPSPVTFYLGGIQWQ